MSDLLSTVLQSRCVHVDWLPPDGVAALAVDEVTRRLREIAPLIAAQAATAIIDSWFVDGDLPRVIRAI
jgi:hypothetical protein